MAPVLGYPRRSQSLVSPTEPAVSNSAGLRTNLDGDTDQYQAAEDFVTVSPELRRGQKTKFTLSAPMRSAARHSLDITAPGVSPGPATRSSLAIHEIPIRRLP